MPDEITGQHADRPTMRAGMPLAERRQLRAWLLEQAMARAREQADSAYLSTRCRSHLEYRDPRLSDEQRRAIHVACLGESAGNGCLCPWHDDEIKPAPGAPEG